MKTFYINLDRREDRNEKFLKSCPLKNELIRFSAIDGRNNRSHPAYQHIKRHMIELNRGEYGCFASHFLLWKQLLNSKDSHYFIFEDDAIFCDDFKKKLDVCLKNIDNMKTVLYIGGRFTPNFKTQYSLDIGDNISKFDYNRDWDGETCDRTAHAYIIHRDVVGKLIEELENPIWNGPLDQFITHVLKKYKLDIFSCNPLLCHSLEVASDSDIRFEN